MQRAATSELGERPNSSNDGPSTDDSDVTTVSLSADASVTEGEKHHPHGDTDESCGWRVRR
ncbi:hypothetical protein OK016_00195 [Vibrio chagasii]|nr:hypothetical protein [Vibrio chagasii]